MKRELSERRKADRELMAEGLVAVAIAAGASAEIEKMGPGEIWVQIKAARGLGLTITLDGQSPQPDVHVLSWFMATNVETRFSDAFTRGGRVSLNTVHYSKATDIAHGYEDLRQALRDGLDLAQSGLAFDPVRESVARNGAVAAQRIPRPETERQAEDGLSGFEP